MHALLSMAMVAVVVAAGGCSDAGAADARAEHVDLATAPHDATGAVDTSFDGCEDDSVACGCETTPGKSSWGGCHACRGQCVAWSDEECQKTSDCYDAGLCSVQDGACVALKDSDCAQGQDCVWRAHCTAVGGKCVTTAKDCANYWACKEDGQCSYDAKDKYSGCIAASNADCLKSTSCTTPDGGHFCWVVKGFCCDQTLKNCVPATLLLP